MGMSGGQLNIHKGLVLGDIWSRSIYLRRRLQSSGVSESTGGKYLSEKRR